MLTNNQKLKALMRVESLTVSDVAKLIGYSNHTVRAWRARPEWTRYRDMPDRALLSLTNALQLRK